MENEVNNIKDGVSNVLESLSRFMESGHLADNIVHLRTNASILNVLAEKLSKLRNNNFNSEQT